MRILHCINNFTIGGTERRLSYLGAELARRGHEIHIAFLQDGPNLERLKSVPVCLHQFDAISNYDPRLLWRLVRLIHKIQPDVIHTWITQMDILGGLAARITNTPHLMSEVTSAQFYNRSWKNFLRIRVAAGAEGIIANSIGGAAYWRAHLPNTLCYIIPNGLPLHEIEAAVSQNALVEFSLKDKEPFVLYVGRFEADKNIKRLIEALALIMIKNPIVGVLCGDGPIRPDNERLVHQLGIADRIRLPGFVLNVWPLMKEATVFVSVSAYEGRPNAVIEAMACGAPLVVSDIPAHREFLDESTALLVNPNNPAEIAEAIQSILLDPIQAQYRAGRAKAKAEEWSIPAMTQQFEQLYMNVLAKRASKKGFGKISVPSSQEKTI